MEEREDLTVSPTDPFKLLAGELGGHMVILDIIIVLGTDLV